MTTLDALAGQAGILRSQGNNQGTHRSKLGRAGAGDKSLLWPDTKDKNAGFFLGLSAAGKLGQKQGH